jgi:hypothetical protein
MTTEVTSLGLERGQPGGRIRRLRVSLSGYKLSLYNIATTLVLASSFLLTILPYLIFKPEFPFGRDMQHPLNIANLLANGTPFPMRVALWEQYPDTYGYLGATLADILGVDPLTVLKILSSVAMLGSAAALYYFALQVYGKYAALFTLLTYGLVSFQPRQSYLDGAEIELVAGLVLLPMFLLALLKTFSGSARSEGDRPEGHSPGILGRSEPSWRWACLAGILAGLIVQYHFLATTQALAVAMVFLAAGFVVRRDLLNKTTLKLLLEIVAIASVVGIPFSFFYGRLYAMIMLGRLGLVPAAVQEAVFPSIGFPQEFAGRLGTLFTVLLVLAVVGLVLWNWRTARVPLADILLLAWIAVMVFGSLTSFFLVSERFLRSLTLPGSLAIGLLFSRLAAMQMGFQPVARGLLAAGLLTFMLAVGAPRIIDQSVSVAATTIYGEPADLPSLEALRRIQAREPNRGVLSDESGIWAPYYVGGKGYQLAGGPEGFKWYGEPERSTMLRLWNAYRDPCTGPSLATFRSLQIGFVYLGRRPGHWTLPGYQYNDGSRYGSCAQLQRVYSEATGQGRITIWRLRTPGEAR